MYGALEIGVAGRADSYEAEIHGASSLDARNFPAAHATVKMHGASRARVDVTESLEGEVSGPSELLYVSRPARLAAEAHFPASVRQEGTRREERHPFASPEPPDAPERPEIR